MRVKLKYALPLAEMALASVLLGWSYHLGWVAMRLCDMPGSAPPFDLVISINFPAALGRAFWSRVVYSAFRPFGPMATFLLDEVMLVAAIGVFWYWMGQNISSWRQRQTIVMFRRLPLRLGGDALITAAALFWCLYGVSRGRYYAQMASFYRGGLGCFGPASWWTWPVLAVIALIHLPVPVLMIFLFGRDLLHAVFRRKPLQESSPI